MARITREQVDKWNSMASNDFKIDMSMLVYHNEKQLVKQVILNENKYITYTLNFREKYNRFEKTLTVNLTKRTWTKTSGDMSTSTGLGHSVKVTEETFTKKNFNKLCTFTETLTEDRINELFNAVENVQDNGIGMILESVH